MLGEHAADLERFLSDDDEDGEEEAVDPQPRNYANRRVD